MKKYISRLQFITYQTKNKTIEEQVTEFCAGGGNWVQLRLKNMTKEDMLPIARKCLSICMQHNTTFIINDYVDLAAKIGADGVHLGKNDVEIDKARSILGQDKIIGGTANTLEDIERLNYLGVDYIGLGPFKFTETKKNLSPVLGLEGYQGMIEECKSKSIQAPIIAIGGIVPDDIPSLFETGIYGIALSSHIAKHENTGLETIHLLSKIGKAQSKTFMKR